MILDLEKFPGDEERLRNLDGLFEGGRVPDATAFVNAIGTLPYCVRVGYLPKVIAGRGQADIDKFVVLINDLIEYVPESESDSPSVDEVSDPEYLTVLLPQKGLSCRFDVLQVGLFAAPALGDRATDILNRALKDASARLCGLVVKAAIDSDMDDQDLMKFALLPLLRKRFIYCLSRKRKKRVGVLDSMYAILKDEELQGLPRFLPACSKELVQRELSGLLDVDFNYCKWWESSHINIPNVNLIDWGRLWKFHSSTLLGLYEGHLKSVASNKMLFYRVHTFWRGILRKTEATAKNASIFRVVFRLTTEYPCWVLTEAGRWHINAFAKLDIRNVDPSRMMNQACEGDFRVSKIDTLKFSATTVSLQTLLDKWNEWTLRLKVDSYGELNGFAMPYCDVLCDILHAICTWFGQGYGGNGKLPHSRRTLLDFGDHSGELLQAQISVVEKVTDQIRNVVALPGVELSVNYVFSSVHIQISSWTNDYKESINKQLDACCRVLRAAFKYVLSRHKAKLMPYVMEPFRMLIGMKGQDLYKLTTTFHSVLGIENLSPEMRTACEDDSKKCFDAYWADFPEDIARICRSEIRGKESQSVFLVKKWISMAEHDLLEAMKPNPTNEDPIKFWESLFRRFPPINLLIELDLVEPMFEFVERLVDRYIELGSASCYSCEIKDTFRWDAESSQLVQIRFSEQYSRALQISLIRFLLDHASEFDKVKTKIEWYQKGWKLLVRVALIGGDLHSFPAKANFAKTKQLLALVFKCRPIFPFHKFYAGIEQAVLNMLMDAQVLRHWVNSYEPTGDDRTMIEYGLFGTSLWSSEWTLFQPCCSPDWANRVFYKLKRAHPFCVGPLASEDVSAAFSILEKSVYDWLNNEILNGSIESRTRKLREMFEASTTAFSLSKFVDTMQIFIRVAKNEQGAHKVLYLENIKGIWPKFFETFGEFCVSIPWDRDGFEEMTDTCVTKDDFIKEHERLQNSWMILCKKLYSSLNMDSDTYTTMTKLLDGLNDSIRVSSSRKNVDEQLQTSWSIAVVKLGRWVLAEIKGNNNFILERSYQFGDKAKVITTEEEIIPFLESVGLARKVKIHDDPNAVDAVKSLQRDLAAYQGIGIENPWLLNTQFLTKDDDVLVQRVKKVCETLARGGWLLVPGLHETLVLLVESFGADEIPFEHFEEVASLFFFLKQISSEWWLSIQVLRDLCKVLYNFVKLNKVEGPHQPNRTIVHAWRSVCIDNTPLILPPTKLSAWVIHNRRRPKVKPGKTHRLVTDSVIAKELLYDANDKSAIYIPFVQKFVALYRQDVIREFIVDPGIDFYGNFNSKPKAQNQHVSFRVSSRLRTRPGTIPNDVNLLISNQLLLDSENTETTFQQRQRAIANYLLNPAVSSTQIVNQLRELYERAAREDQEDGDVSTKTASTISTYIEGVFGSDHPLAGLAFLLSPDIIKCDTGNATSVALLHVQSLLPQEKLTQVLKLTLSDDRRGVLSISLHRSIVKLLFSIQSEDSVGLLTKEWRTPGLPVAVQKTMCEYCLENLQYLLDDDSYMTAFTLEVLVGVATTILPPETDKKLGATKDLVSTLFAATPRPGQYFVPPVFATKFLKTILCPRILQKDLLFGRAVDCICTYWIDQLDETTVECLLESVKPTEITSTTQMAKIQQDLNIVRHRRQIYTTMCTFYTKNLKTEQHVLKNLISNTISAILETPMLNIDVWNAEHQKLTIFLSTLQSIIESERPGENYESYEEKRDIARRIIQDLNPDVIHAILASTNSDTSFIKKFTL
uniref:Uncharacterized protein n=1 Tax=Mucochytrium quahogii TaxID=96639 RepID=A0A7S2WRJ9_9STRA|mmetsp:Transcript_3435/g.6586  ORF Transcript_3435/g.6586 Transcript_3435/m.6586 type:complete len:1764 (+) Transcript_3435:79-5370(+)|eukprot:CAMPEP_0203759018 /NCGR_PEP_ID=MMETSP0098-20131031/11941_1 /ASSEMBLY_ACC=CAM_ASM_000208 /TAXON_ID=96639 /ORGANISM=" , Strain NY0313808BC1" /LENGTH=1763 /DNA_ID=CAMNT_0050651745 /DNA_START=60 /DNA_END=5351 /DNA_ORIENTATION=+